MKREKYQFNRETLSYEKVSFNFKKFFLKKILPQSIVSLLLGTVFAIIGTYNFSSPLESKLQTENDNIKYSYKKLNNKIHKISTTLAELQESDDEVYRTIFGADPIPATVRNAGYGGTDRYKSLKGFSESNLMINSTRELDVVSKKIIIQSNSYDEIVNLVKDKEKMLACIPAICPITNKELTRFGSPFGMRMHPILGYLRLHAGIDLTAPKGTPIYASGNGIVTRADASNRGYGNHVRISHGYGYTTVYAHMSKMLVKPGQKVKRGDLIGLVGSTGLSTAPHLHYEVRINNKPVDPVNFYYNDLSDEEYAQMIEEAKNSNTHVYEW